MKKNRKAIQKMIMVSMFAGLTAILSQISIPLPFTPIPFNLGILGFLLSGSLLGKWLGAASQLIYVLLGAVGLPVFAGFHGGLSTLVGPTGGFLLGYIFAAFVIGLLLEKLPKKLLPLALTIGVITCYAFGTIFFMVNTSSSLFTALTLCIFPFILVDALKIFLASILVLRLKTIMV